MRATRFKLEPGTGIFYTYAMQVSGQNRCPLETLNLKARINLLTRARLCCPSHRQLPIHQCRGLPLH